MLASRSATGFFSINLSAFTWDAAADKVRFIIGGENYSSQGTVEFDYFSYSPSFITGKTPTLDIKLRTTGALAGINYDQLALTTISTVNVSGTKLKVTDNASDPVGTIYTVVSYPLGTIAGTFATVTLSPTLGNLTYNSKSITVQKIMASVLPLSWISFTAVAEKNQVVLNWSTQQETNTSLFTIEYSSDGINFLPIGNVPAKNTYSNEINYTYTDKDPRNNPVRYYRIKETDIDGKSSYSVVRSVKLQAEQESIKLFPNPVKFQLSITVFKNNTDIFINDINGRLITKIKLATGTHHLSADSWMPGLYQLSVYNDGMLKETRKLVKL